MTAATSSVGGSVYRARIHLEPGDIVGRRHGRGESRFGQIIDRWKPDYVVFYVNVGIGMTHIDWARDLRPATGALRRAEIGGIRRFSDLSSNVNSCWLTCQVRFLRPFRHS